MAIAERSLRRGEWRILVVLGVPTFALALGVTTVSTYLPVLAEGFSNSSIVVGLLIGGEGLMALWLPLVVGSWSDRLRTPIGGRLPFIIVATPPLVVALALIGFVQSVAAAAILVAVFFMGYFVAYEPYRALYPDLVDHEIAGPRPEHTGDLPRDRHVPRPPRRRLADLDLRSAAVPGRGRDRRRMHGRVRGDRRALSPARHQQW
jgi:hypothetical protein